MPRPRTKPAPPPPHGPDALDRLRELVGASGLSRADVAGRAGMSPAQLNAYLSGHRRNPSVATIARVLAALGRSWADLD